MIRFPKINQLEIEPPIGHDVGRLQVKVSDAILRQIPKCLNDDYHKVNFGLER